MNSKINKKKTKYVKGREVFIPDKIIRVQTEKELKAALTKAKKIKWIKELLGRVKREDILAIILLWGNDRIKGSEVLNILWELDAEILYADGKDDKDAFVENQLSKSTLKRIFDEYNLQKPKAE